MVITFQPIRSGLKNQMHQQLSYHYPSYKKSFCDIDGKSALAFWEKYPAPHQALTVGVDELAEYLREANHNTFSTRKAEGILELVKQDGETKRKFQEYGDFLIVNMVGDMRRSRELIKYIEEQLWVVLAQTDYRLESMDGISTVTAAELIAEIGDIRPFSNADKLARFTGIVPVRFSSGGKGKDHASGQGNRVLNAIFHNLSVQQIQVDGIGPRKSPDFIIEGQVFDCYAPESTNLSTISKMLRDKTTNQARRIVLNLNDYPFEKRTELIEFILGQTHKDLKHLNELLVIEGRQVTRAYWRYE